MMVAGSAAADVASMVVLLPPAANPGVAMASSGFEHLPNSKSCTMCVCVSQIFIENPLVALLLQLAPLSEKHWHQAVLKKNSHLINLLMSDAIPITIRYLLDVP